MKFTKWLEARTGTTNWGVRQPVRDFRSMSTSKVTFGDLKEPVHYRALAGVTGALGQVFTSVMYPGGVGLPSTPPNWPWEKDESDKHIDVAGELPIKPRDDTKPDTPFTEQLDYTLDLMEQQAIAFIQHHNLIHQVDVSKAKRIWKKVTPDGKSVQAAFRFPKTGVEASGHTEYGATE